MPVATMTEEEILNESQGDLDVSQLDPDNLPSDPEELLRLLNGEGKAEPESEAEEEETDEKPEPESSTEQTQEEEDAPILSADGKHQIPYAVLKQEREARRAAAEQAAALEAELTELKSAQATGVAIQAEIPTYDPNDPEIQALESEFPEIARANRAARAEIDRLRQEMQTRDARIEAMASQWEREQQVRQQAEMEKVHAAIDANPTLRYLRSEDGDQRLWSAAVEIDMELQNRPAWADKPVVDRFAAVVRRLEEDYGPVTVPGKYQSATPAATKAKPKDDDLTINTLSDLRGGSSPESSGINAEKMSAEQIGDYFLKMDPSQLAKIDPAEILARL